jgi:hypothetical protein
MAAKGDVKAVRVTATGSVFAGRTRLRGIILSNATVTLQDETGTQFIGDCPAGDVFSFNLPEDGILFKGFMTVNAISGLTAATILLDK